MKKYHSLIVIVVGIVMILQIGEYLGPSPKAAEKQSVEKLMMNSADESRMRITFINPGISDPKDPTGGFWLSVSSFMQAAAKQLNINLEIIYSDRDHIRMQQQAREVASRPIPPDYLIVVNEKLAADEMLKVADRTGINVFVMLNAFTGEQAKELGLPREKHKNWIGSLIPDNTIAGYLIARQIITEATAKGGEQNGRIKLFAIAGDPVTQASVQRVEGLRKAVHEYPNAELQQVFYGEWSQDIAYQQAQIALLRYPETNAIWAANDPMAEGAIRGALESKRHPGEDIFIGGLNWDKPALAMIKDGSLTTSVGGHFMTGGWALVLLYDYHHGKDFTDEGVALQYPIFGVLDRNNINAFLDKFENRDWNKIDFRKFSKVLNPNLQKYNFSSEAVIQQ
ncbi:MAG: ABC transporter substrate-binding protein [Proteobacteria bacterium]|nr:ABC transporter substrate-binding protein [Pseudomonadota bacterium]